VIATVGYDVFGVIQVEGADPEVFWIIWIDPQLRRGSFMKTSQNLTESEVLTELKKIGRTEAEIDSLIKRAREKPR
jgi:hypothetical protein